MPVPAMDERVDERVVDHQRRFQAAVDVVHNLPKRGSYRPSYELMLRFYSLYKQAVCGPCSAPRPGFWDPVGRYKWDAWSRLGGMDSEVAMAAYVDEMKKVAQEVIDTTPINEKTASLFHQFEPLYLVIEDMPRPPQSLLTLREGLKRSEDTDMKDEEEEEEEEEEEPKEGSLLPENLDLDLDPDLESKLAADAAAPEFPALTSDSESEIFCDSVDSVEQLSSVKIPLINGFQNGHAASLESRQRPDARQVGAGQGGEGGGDVGKGPASNRRRDGGRDDAARHSWRERGVPQGGPRWAGPGGGGGGGAGRGGGDGSEGGAERMHDAQLQQQIMVALRRLREDMRSVMERLEVVERLAGSHAQGSEWRKCLQCAAAASSSQQQEDERWWPFDVSGQTVLLFLVWPFVAQGVVYLMRKAQKRSRVSL